MPFGDLCNKSKSNIKLDAPSESGYLHVLTVNNIIA